MSYKHTPKHSFDAPLPLDARYDLGAVMRVLGKIHARLDELSVAKRWAEELYPDGRHDLARGQSGGVKTFIRSRVLRRMATVRDEQANALRRAGEEAHVAAWAGRRPLTVTREMIESAPADVYTSVVYGRRS